MQQHGGTTRSKVNHQIRQFDAETIRPQPRQGDSAVARAWADPVAAVAPALHEGVQDSEPFPHRVPYVLGKVGEVLQGDDYALTLVACEVGEDRGHPS